MDSAQFFRDIADTLIFERGEFDPLQFLIDAGFLDEDVRAEWRDGEHENLESVLACEVEEAIDALELVRKYLLKQGLTERPRATSDIRSPLGVTAKFVRACELVLLPAQPQRDLFRDTAGLVAEQTAKAELAAHRHGAAAEALERLSKLTGPSELECCLRELLDAGTSKPPASLAEHQKWLETSIAPLATRHLGREARAYLSPLWRSLAQRLNRKPFDPNVPDLHASNALARANDWRSVVKAVEAEKQWDSHEALVLRAAEAHARLGNREAARRAWTRLCWTHPASAARVLANAPGDPQLARRWREFIDCDPELPAQDFPAWLLIADLKQRESVPASFADQSPIGAAYSAIHRLIEQSDDIDARRVVNEYDRNLLGHFLSRRKS